MKTCQISNLLLIVVLLAACEPVPPASVLSIQNGWVRALPPGMKMTAAYGVIGNHGSDTIEISSFNSDSFEEVSLHLTTIENGVSSMERLPGLKQSAGASTVLEPGGVHLMLMRPTRDIRPGDMVGLTLTTAGGQQFQFSLPVEAR
jgi:copper(I)-binding protein